MALHLWAGLLRSAHCFISSGASPNALNCTTYSNSSLVKINKSAKRNVSSSFLPKHWVYLYNCVSLRPHDRITQFCPTDMLVSWFYLHVSLRWRILIFHRREGWDRTFKGLTFLCTEKFNLAIFTFHIYQGFFIISRTLISGLLVSKAADSQTAGHDR